VSVISITKGLQLDKISSSTKHISDDGNNFVQALNKLSTNTQDTDPTKTKQPTNDNLPYANRNIEPQEEIISYPDNEPNLQPVVITSLNIKEPSADLNIAIIPTDIIETSEIPDINTEPASTVTEDLFIPTISTPDPDKVSDDKMETPNLEKEFVPDAIVSSEVHEQIPVFTPLLVQEPKTDITTDVAEEQPQKPSLLPGDTTIQEDLPTILPTQDNLSSIPIDTSPDAAVREQSAFISVAANIDNQKIISKTTDIKAPQESDPFAMVESVKVQPISDMSDTHPDMSFTSNDEKLELDSQNLQQESSADIESFSTIAKPIITQTVDATTESEQTTDMKSISNQLKAAVENVHNINGKRITITLTPESLGRVEVELTLKAGQITAIEIKAVKPETLQILEKNSQMLQDTLKEVTSSNDASLSFNLKEGNHQHNQQEQKTSNANIAPFDLNDIDAKDVVPTQRTLTQTNNAQNNEKTTSSRINMKL